MRTDDNRRNFKTRLHAYYKQTAPLIGYYYAKGKLEKVDGMADIDEVAAQIEDVLEADGERKAGRTVDGNGRLTIAAHLRIRREAAGSARTCAAV